MSEPEGYWIDRASDYLDENLKLKRKIAELEAELDLLRGMRNEIRIIVGDDKS